jgi:hypothetical protein
MEVERRGEERDRPPRQRKATPIGIGLQTIRADDLIKKSFPTPSRASAYAFNHHQHPPAKEERQMNGFLFLLYDITLAARARRPSYPHPSTESYPQTRYDAPFTFTLISTYNLTRSRRFVSPFSRTSPDIRDHPSLSRVAP